MSVHEIHDALPAGVANALRNFFVMGLYYKQEQFEPDQYQERTWHKDLPGKDEMYRASFGQSIQVAEHPAVKEAFDSFIFPKIESTLGIKIAVAELLAYRLQAGDHFRFHKDDYAGVGGFTYYLSKGWKWDWGGLLLSQRGEEIVPTIPEFNKLVIFDHRQAETSPPHCVTPVTSWAKEPRFMLVGLVN